MKFFKEKKRKKWQKATLVKISTKETILSEQQKLSNVMAQHGIAVFLIIILVSFVMFKWINGSINGKVEWSQTCFLGVLLILLAAIGWIGFVNFFSKPLKTSANFNRLLGTVFVYAFITKGIILLGFSQFFAPVALFAMVTTLMFSKYVAAYLVMCFALFSGFMSPEVFSESSGGTPLLHAIDFTLMLALLMGGFTAVIGTGRMRSQSRPIWIGFVSGCVQGVVIFVCGMLSSSHLSNNSTFSFLGPYTKTILVNSTIGLSSGLVCGVIITIVLPALEYFFDILTERRLLELSDLSNELLTTFALRAPGSFTHSQNVANLSSEAAKAIGADELLVRVGAYYHDIGKIYKPDYFTENCIPGASSPHDRLSPEMSRLVIMSHVKDGIGIAEEENLPNLIRSMIPMHHGTTIVRYFYQRAKDQADVGARYNTDMESYRYPGPKPTFKEAGILMLADVVEAVSRTLKNPTPQHLQTLVHKLIFMRLEEHELDHSELTMRDIFEIEKSFSRTLSTQIFHGRIPYPEAKKNDNEKRKENGRQ